MSIKSDSGFRLLAAQHMQKQLQAMSKEIDGVRRADDIENIHRMRVATRRLRAGFRAFESAFSAKDRANWRKIIKKTTKSLGHARDTDVQIVFLEAFLESLSAEDARKYQGGVERLLLRLQQRRTDLQPKVVAAMDRLDRSGVIGHMTDAVRAMNVAASLETKTVSTPACYLEAGRRILFSLEEFLSFDPFVRDETNVEKLHEARIAGKRLRYTIEIFAPVYEDGLREHIKHLKSVQDLLGDLHDCDVWDSFLDDFVRAEERRHLDFVGSRRGFARVRRGIQYLRDVRRSERHELFQQFVGEWNAALHDGFWTALRSQVQDCAIRSSAGDPFSIAREMPKAHDSGSPPPQMKIQ